MDRVKKWLAQLWFDICRHFAMYILRDVGETKFRYDGGFKKCPLTGDYIRYVVDDEYAIVAGYYKQPYIGLSKDYDHHWTIVSNTEMKNAPLVFREAFRLNRLGHIALKHHPHMVADLSKEIEADEWAIQQGAEMKRAIEWYIDHTNPFVIKRLPMNRYESRLHVLRYGHAPMCCA